jgi:hypothetical protein
MPQIPDVLMLACLLSMGPVQAPNAITRETTTVATVDRIERSSRVLIAHSRGDADAKVMHTFYVDPAVKAFEDLKVGDVVTVRFTKSVVVQVRPDAKPTELQDTTEATRKAGDAHVVQQHKRIVIVEDVDPQGLSVTYRTQDNLRGVHPVQNKELLKGLRRGDRIEITVTLARAVSIEPKR